MRSTMAVLVCALAVAGCGADSFGGDCEKEGRATRERYGEPEEIRKYDSGDYHSHTWWYWSRGFSRNFTWSKDISCEQSDYTFTPIPRR